MTFPNWFAAYESNIKLYKAWHLHASGLARHGFSTRIGGSSRAPFETLNLALAVEDDHDIVLANRRAFASAIGVDAEKIVVPKQVHGNNVMRVDDSHAGLGATDHSTAIVDTDALVTDTPGLTLALHFADCVAVFLVDPERRAIGLAHAGWRGTASSIVVNTVEAMRREFGTSPGNILAAIGPAIARNCYDVGQDVARELTKTFPGDERVLKQSSSATWRADLKTANRILLCRAGVPESNIAVSECCTACVRDEFFSYRRDGPTGRMGGWMSLV